MGLLLEVDRTQQINFQAMLLDLFDNYQTAAEVRYWAYGAFLISAILGILKPAGTMLVILLIQETTDFEMWALKSGVDFHDNAN